MFSEYTLLNVFPRDIADAHVSGAIHVNGLGTWLLKPNEVLHDLRFFFQNGFRTANPFRHSGNPPQSLESALSTILNVLLQADSEVNDMQTCYYFNIFLAPFARGIDTSKLKEQLRQFILNVNRKGEATLGIDLTIPKFIADKQAIGPQGKTNETYRDFAEETRLIAQLTIEAFTEENSTKPLLNPKLILKINKEALANENTKATLLQAHSLAADKGTIYFANTEQKDGKQTAFSGTGCRFETELTGDWETDILRTGCIGAVAINLPRIVQESEKEKNKFFEILKERCELAARALEIKHRALKQHGKTALPFLNQSANGDTYLRLENCSSIINLAGLKECVETFCEKDITSPESKDFAEEIAQTLITFKGKLGKKHGKRLFPTVLRSKEASERLAQLDIEKYGLAKVKFSGTRDKPFYSTTNRLQTTRENTLSLSPENLNLAQKLKGLNAGANLSIIELEKPEYKPEELLNLTTQIIENQTVEFFTYNRITTYCSNCNKTWPGNLYKCPSCGSISTLTTFDRFNST